MEQAACTAWMLCSKTPPTWMSNKFLRQHFRAFILDTPELIQLARKRRARRVFFCDSQICAKLTDHKKAVLRSTYHPVAYHYRDDLFDYILRFVD